MPWPYDPPPDDPTTDAEQAALDRAYAARRRHSNMLVVTGAILFVAGLGVTCVTCSSAMDGGGTYIVAWGPIVVGFRRIARGLSGD
jgi:hypothetical protein